MPIRKTDLLDPEARPPKKKPGRKPGQKNRGTLLQQTEQQAMIKEALAAGITPLEYMLGVMRTPPKPYTPPERLKGEDADVYRFRCEKAEQFHAQYLIRTDDRRMEAAKNAAPYIHPRLAQIEHKGDLKLAHEHALAELE